MGGGRGQGFFVLIQLQSFSRSLVASPWEWVFLSAFLLLLFAAAKPQLVSVAGLVKKSFPPFLQW